MQRLLVTSLSLVAFAGLAACNKAEGAQIEKKLMERFKASGGEFKAVKCPKTIEVKVDATFTCTGTTMGDETLTINGKITSKSGSNFEYTYEVAESVYIADKLATGLGEDLTKQTGIKPTSVDCGPAGVHKVPANLTVVCTAVDPKGIGTKIDIKFKADGTIEGWAAEGGPPPPAGEAPPAGDPPAGDPPAGDPPAAPQ